MSAAVESRRTFRAVANSDLVVSNDSAPVLMALSTGAKVVGHFGPRLQRHTFHPIEMRDGLAVVWRACVPSLGAAIVWR